MTLSATTERLYSGAWASFARWCRDRRIRAPASHADIAHYLADVQATRGASAVPVHLSAIAWHAREAGYAVDTKAHVIQAVIGDARRMIREARDD